MSNIKDFTFDSSDVTKEELGLDKVDNTADLDKPVSTAQQEAINAAANTSIDGGTASGIGTSTIDGGTASNS